MVYHILYDVRKRWLATDDYLRQKKNKSIKNEQKKKRFCICHNFLTMIGI